jgi:hypothetical protein
MHTTARDVALFEPSGKSLAVRLAAVHQPPDRTGIRKICQIVLDRDRGAMESWRVFMFLSWPSFSSTVLAFSTDFLFPAPFLSSGCGHFYSLPIILILGLFCYCGY